MWGHVTLPNSSPNDKAINQFGLDTSALKARNNTDEGTPMGDHGRRGVVERRLPIGVFYGEV